MSNVALVNIANRSSDQVATAPVGWRPAFVQSYVAEATIQPNRVVAFGTDDRLVFQSSGGAQLNLGVYLGEQPTVAGDQIPVAVGGIALVRVGVSGAGRGNKLTSDGVGQVIPAATTNNVIGIALAFGLSGDLIPVLIMQSTFP